MNRKILGVFSLNRTVHRITLSIVTAIGICAGTRYVPNGDPVFLLAITFGYLALLLMLLTLMVGPINLLLKQMKRNPVNLMLRRDIGIWAGILTIMHVILAVQLRFGGQLLYYFVSRTDNGRLTLRLDLFGFSNFAGALALLLISLLLATSNQYALRKLKGPRWKALQRWNYVAILLVIAHTAGYQTVALREQYFETVTVVLVILTLVIQMIGVRATRRSHRSQGLLDVVD